MRGGGRLIEEIRYIYHIIISNFCTFKNFAILRSYFCNCALSCKLNSACS